MTNMKVSNYILMNKMAGELSRMNIIAENDFRDCRIALSLTLPSLGPFRLPQRWRRSKRETSISGDLLSDRAARLPGREVAFPALRATRTTEGARALAESVELIQGRSLPFCRCFTTLITSSQRAFLPPSLLSSALFLRPSSERGCG